MSERGPGPHTIQAEPPVPGERFDPGPPKDERMLTLSGRLTLDDLLAIGRYHDKWQVPPLHYWTWGTICGLAACGVISRWLDVDILAKLDRVILGMEDWGPLLLDGVIVICAAWWLGLRMLWRYFSIRHGYRKQKEQLPEATATLTQSDIMLSDPLSDTRVNWIRIYAILDTPDGLMFYLSKQAFWFFLPSRILDEITRALILEWARSNRVGIKEMKCFRWKLDF